MTFLTDDRGVSTAVTHALAIGISSMLILTMLVSLGGFLDGQEKRATDQQLQTVGERVVTELTAAERYAVNGGETVSIDVTHPERVAGQTYRIRLTQSGTDVTMTMEYERSTQPLRYTFEVGSSTSLATDPLYIDSGDFEIVVEETGSGYTIEVVQ